MKHIIEILIVTVKFEVIAPKRLFLSILFLKMQTILWKFDEKCKVVCVQSLIELASRIANLQT